MPHNSILLLEILIFLPDLFLNILEIVATLLFNFIELNLASGLDAFPLFLQPVVLVVTGKQIRVMGLLILCIEKCFLFDELIQLSL